jgi:hypothetical protein
LEKAIQAGQVAELSERWVQAARKSRWKLPAVDPDDLRKFYHELDAAKREYLESLPAERMQYELRRMYLFRQFAEGSPGMRHGFGFPGRGPHPKPGERPGGPSNAPSPGPWGSKPPGRPPGPPSTQPEAKRTGETKQTSFDAKE